MELGTDTYILVYIGSRVLLGAWVEDHGIWGAESRKLDACKAIVCVVILLFTCTCSLCLEF